MEENKKVIGEGKKWRRKGRGGGEKRERISFQMLLEN